MDMNATYKYIGFVGFLRGGGGCINLRFLLIALVCTQSNPICLRDTRYW